jgi:hypothetical protein
MLRSIAAIIAGYLVIAIFPQWIINLFKGSGVYDWNYMPAFDSAFLIFSSAITFVGAIICGYITAFIAGKPPIKQFITLVVFIGIIIVVFPISLDLNYYADGNYYSDGEYITLVNSVPLASNYLYLVIFPVVAGGLLRICQAQIESGQRDNSKTQSQQKRLPIHPGQEQQRQRDPLVQLNPHLRKKSVPMYTEPRKQQKQQRPLIRLGVIGQSNSGKTVLNLAAHYSLRNFVTASNLQFEPEDPQKYLELDRKLITAIETMRRVRLPSTFAMDYFDYGLYAGDAIQAALRLPEVIGQALSDPNYKKEGYDDYLGHLGQADILWVVLSIQSISGMTFDEQLGRSVKFLRQALADHQEQSRPVAVVLTQIDGDFSSEKAAREKMTETSLRESLKPLITLLSTSNHVHEAALFPVSSFGFGNVFSSTGGQISRDTSQSQDNASDADPAVQNIPPNNIESGNWQLKPDAIIEPFNIQPLIIWSCLKSLQNKSFPNNSNIKEQGLCNQLLSDLHAMNGWFIPLKGM